MSEPQKTPLPAVVPIYPSADPQAGGSANPSGDPVPPPPSSSSGMSAPPASSPPYPMEPSSTTPLYNEPPPSYSAAVNLPTQPPYQQPGANPAYPKPFYTSQAAYPQAPYPNQGYPQFPPLPQPPQPAAQPIVVNVTTVPGEVVLRCAHCSGVMISDTDVCCVVCLIALTIFTFPIGLIFLCCIPCTVRRRCSNCRRIG